MRRARRSERCRPASVAPAARSKATLTPVQWLCFNRKMAYGDDRLDAIFARTDGRCHICGKRLCRGNYGALDARAAWEVDHSVARARGGHDTHLNNLYAACISCNRRKRAVSTRGARGYHGRKRAPLALEAKRRIRRDNALAGGFLAGSGALLLGLAPPVALVLTAAGALVAHRFEPDPQKRIRRR